MRGKCEEVWGKCTFCGEKVKNAGFSPWKFETWDSVGRLALKRVVRVYSRQAVTGADACLQCSTRSTPAKSSSESDHASE